MSHLLFDVGGTRTRVGISSDLQQIDQHEIITTPASFQEGMIELVKQIKQLSKENSVDTIVGGLPGPLNAESSGMWRAPNLPKWEGQNIKSILQQEFPNTYVEIKNDTYLVGLGEVTKSTEAIQNPVGYIGIGTGCGGARYDRDLPAVEYPSEPGHQLIPVGNHWVELEDLIGGAGLRERFDVDEVGLQRTNVKQFATIYAAIGLYNVSLVWNVRALIVGGGMIETGVIEFNRLKAVFDQLPQVFASRTSLIRAQLDGLGGLWGGLEIARQIKNGKITNS